jgi:lipoyl(octanoyl) transferase
LVPDKVLHIHLGTRDYKEVWDLQKNILSFKQKNNFPDVILTTEHNNVYTLGKSGDKNHLLLSSEQLKDKQITFYETDRGGDLTYHGPGQLVCYPIFDLHNYTLDTHKYLRNLEQTVQLTLEEYGIESQQDEQYTGVWVGSKKICAIGIKVSRWITMHGLALNVNNDLNYFDNIIPCGIFHKGVTSMKEILKREINMGNLISVLTSKIKLQFGIYDVITIDHTYLNEILDSETLG